MRWRTWFCTYASYCRAGTSCVYHPRQSGALSTVSKSISLISICNRLSTLRRIPRRELSHFVSLRDFSTVLDLPLRVRSWPGSEDSSVSTSISLQVSPDITSPSSSLPYDFLPSCASKWLSESHYCPVCKIRLCLKHRMVCGGDGEMEISIRTGKTQEHRTVPSSRQSRNVQMMANHHERFGLLLR
eukprot:767413-Hanusia_phi.AAC.2